MSNKQVEMSPIEDVVAAIARGEMIVMVDDEDRENEGDLIMAAQFATAEKIAFIVRHTSGVVVAPLSGERCDDLRLPLMVDNNTESHRTAFTISDNVWHESSSWGSSTYMILGYTPTYLIVQNPSTDAYNPSLWSKIEFHNRVASVGFRSCTTVYDAATWAAAYSTVTTTIYNTSNAAAGCNGFGHTIVTANGEGR